MSAVLEPVGEPTMLGTPNRFLVLWQHPETRTFHQIGLLSRSAHGYSFAYGPAVESIPGFAPLANFPNTARTYDSVDLFPVFANRVMTTRRDGYAQYVAALGLGPTPEPFEVLARTLGTRATDRIQVLPLPDPTPDGHIHLVFLVHGIRHVDPDGLQMAQLREGDTLHLAPEDDNPVNQRAMLVGAHPYPTRETALGYVPDALVELVRRLMRADPRPHLRVERINPPEGLLPDSMRLLARLDAVVGAHFDTADASDGLSPIVSGTQAFGRALEIASIIDDDQVRP